MKTVDRSRRILTAACIVAFCLILDPAIEVSAQSKGFSEDCIFFDVDSWMNSRGHRANMLSNNATHLGTGACNAGSKYSNLYFDALQVFARIID